MDVHQSTIQEQALAAKLAVQDLLSMIGDDHGADAGLKLSAHAESVLWVAESVLRDAIADGAEEDCQ